NPKHWKRQRCILTIKHSTTVLRLLNNDTFTKPFFPDDCNSIHMKIKMILPALTEAKSPYWRPVKYSLFPPLGLATLAAYCSEDDEVFLQDEHVEEIITGDSPDIVVIQVYITNAFRAYQLADHYRKNGAYVCLGGLHVTSLPEEAMQYADTIFLGPGEESWPRFLKDFTKGNAAKKYTSRERTLETIPPIRRDL